MATALDAPLDDVPIIAGPMVNGRPTEVRSFTTAQLPSAPALPHLLQCINTAFAHSHASHPSLNMPADVRLPTTAALLDHLHDDKDTCIIIVTAPGDPKVLATASYRRYRGPVAADTSIWDRTTIPAPGWLEWELKLMAVDISLQKQGLASYLINYVDTQIVRASPACADYVPGAGIKVLLSTAREMNGNWYGKRGYEIEHEIWRGEGQTFHIAFMAKVLAPRKSIT